MSRPLPSSVPLVNPNLKPMMEGVRETSLHLSPHPHPTHTEAVLEWMDGGGPESQQARGSTLGTATLVNLVK